MDIGADDPRLNLCALVEIARTVDGREAVAEAICALAVSELSLAGASIGLVRRDAEGSHLESVAAVGQLSPFIRDLTTPLGAETDATKTALGGEPIFEGNPHGVGDGENADGVARWRNGFGSHAYALLALNTLEGTIGVLTLEWPRPQSFPAETRENLQLYASVTALIMRGVPVDVEPNGAVQADAHQAERAACEDADLAAYEANSRGLVVPAPLAVTWGQRTVARIWTAATPRGASTGSAAFAEVMSVPNDSFMLVTGSVSAEAGTDARHVAATGASVMRAAATHGSSSAEVLGMLSSSMRAQDRGAWASGIAMRFHPATGAVEVAESGSVALLMLGREGRFELRLPLPTTPSRGFPSPSRTQLALPGDRIAIVSGSITALEDSAIALMAEEALASVTNADGCAAAVELLSLVCAEGTDAAVTVLHVADAPAAPPD